MNWIEIRDPYSGDILLRFEPDADLIEIMRRKRLTLINLKLHRMRARQAQAEKDKANIQNKED
jgi:hypothetical protein